MNQFQVSLGVICWMALLVLSPLSRAQPAEEPSIISLADLEAFQPAADAWQIAGTVRADRNASGEMSAEPGQGILVQRPDNGNGGNLATEMTHGDLRLELDYMMSKGAEAGIFLQGRYEVQMADSWGVRNPRVSDHGGIFRHDGSGLHPRTNASRAPGLWQHLEIVFQAPRFDAGGTKTRNAVIKKVAVNGVVVQEDVEMARPSPGAPAGDERSEGSLVFEEGTAPVAFRNIRYWSADRAVVESEEASEPVEPIWVEPTDRPIVLRSYVRHRNQKKLNGVFVGDPAGVHYALDLDRGSLLLGWKGEFLDAGTVWRGRGMEPDSRLLDEPEPLGSTITFSGAPEVAVLNDIDAAWPDTAHTTYRFEGYSMTTDGRPVFNYRLHGIDITDRFRPDRNGRTLRRQLTFEGSVGNRTIYSRLAEAPVITETDQGLYTIGDYSYFIKLRDSSGEAPVVRRRNGRAELLVPVSVGNGQGTLEYSIIW
jgi:hypothetical protein